MLILPTQRMVCAMIRDGTTETFRIWPGEAFIMPGHEIRCSNPFLPEAPWRGPEQFREPLCYEPQGRAFQLVMDNGCRYALHFISGEMIARGEQGKALRWDTYECTDAAAGIIPAGNGKENPGEGCLGGSKSPLSVL